MKGKEIAILFFIISVLVFYIFSEKKEKVHYTLPEIGTFKKDDISKLILKKKDREILLIKKNDRWYVGEKRYPADKTKVNRMLETLSELTLTALVSESGNYTLYELDDEHRIDVSAYRGEKLLRKISIGKPAPSYRHTFVLIGDDKRVYHAKGNFRYEFDKDVAQLRDMIVLSFNEEITEVTFKKGKKELKIVRTEAPVSEEKEQEEKREKEKWQTEDGKIANSEIIREIIDTLSNLRCDKFIDDKKKEDFSSPVYEVILKGVNVYTISIFDKEKEENRYPAITSYSDYPFYLSEWKVKKIMKDFDEILKSSS